eukprot:7384529-Prymnesium_polylepis.1
MYGGHLETFPSQDGQSLSISRWAKSSRIGRLELISGHLKTSNASQVCSGRVSIYGGLSKCTRGS